MQACGATFAAGPGKISAAVLRATIVARVVVEEIVGHLYRKDQIDRFKSEEYLHRRQSRIA